METRSKQKFIFGLAPALLLVVLIACTGSDNPIFPNTAYPDGGVPSGSDIRSIFPNPTDTVTTIMIGIESRSFVKLYIQNPVGLKLYSLIEDTLDGGFYSRQWNLTNQNGSTLRNGLYFVTLEIPEENFRQSKVLEIH